MIYFVIVIKLLIVFAIATFVNTVHKKIFKVLFIIFKRDFDGLIL